MTKRNKVTNKVTSNAARNAARNVTTQAKKDIRVIWRQLTLGVHSSPDNLRLHTQRILFCLDNHLSEHISGALHDLFVVLKEKGVDLRQRMFNLASPVMSFADRAYFKVWLSENSDKSLACYQFSGSVIESKTCQHQNGKIMNSFKVAPHFNHVLEEAEYKIESGQLDQAQVLLETSYLSNPNDIAIQKELQRFYFHAKKKKSMGAFIVRLNDSGVKLSKTWIDLQEMSNKW